MNLSLTIIIPVFNEEGNLQVLFERLEKIREKLNSEKKILTNYIFVNEKQFSDYIKFILIASIALDYQSFLYYFFEVMFILSLLSFFKVFSKKNIISIGYVFAFPLLWILIIQPINY